MRANCVNLLWMSVAHVFFFHFPRRCEKVNMRVYVKLCDKHTRMYTYYKFGRNHIIHTIRVCSYIKLWHFTSNARRWKKCSETFLLIQNFHGNKFSRIQIMLSVVLRWRHIELNTHALICLIPFGSAHSFMASFLFHSQAERHICELQMSANMKNAILCCCYYYNFGITTST